MQQVIFNTAGDGYWSTAAKAVTVTNIKLLWADEDKEFGELAVYFDTKTWNIEQDGLIYTDNQFEEELNEFLAQHGLPAADYSEQGMQGDDYVSLDVGKNFIAAWTAKFGELTV